MKHRTLFIGEIDATNGPVMYTCYGLGSCIGLFIADRVKGLSGGAHIPLPVHTEIDNLKGADQLIDTLLESLSRLGSDLVSLRAKAAGGAQLFQLSGSIGKQTTKAVLQRLTDQKIYLASADLGGWISRTARFNSLTGDLLISTSEQKTYII